MNHEFHFHCWLIDCAIEIIRNFRLNFVHAGHTESIINLEIFRQMRQDLP